MPTSPAIRPVTRADHARWLPLWNAYNVGWVQCNANGCAQYLGNTTVFNTQLAVFACPSDGKRRQVSTCNYVGNVGGPYQTGGYSGTFIPTANSWPETAAPASPLSERTESSELIATTSRPPSACGPARGRT